MTTKAIFITLFGIFLFSCELICIIEMNDERNANANAFIVWCKYTGNEKNLTQNEWQRIRKYLKSN
jgi:hypothetical protein